MAAFSACWHRTFLSKPGSSTPRWASTAPPCTRSSSPSRSRPARSRRMVISETDSCSASPEMSAEPLRCTSSRMHCRRSTASMLGSYPGRTRAARAHDCGGGGSAGQALPGAVTKSISSSTRPRNAGSRSVKDRTEPRMRRQAAPVFTRPADGGQHALLPRLAARHLRPAAGQPDCGRLDRGPDIDERVADDQHVRRGHRVGDPGLLGAGHQVVDEHAEPRAGPGRELGHDRGQVVDAAQVLHHHADVAQVVAPDLLDQLGVVQALDVDPAGLGHLGPALRRRHRPEAVRRGAPAPGEAGRVSRTGRPSSRNVPVSGNTRHLPCRSSSVTASFSQNTTAPQNSPALSSMTRPRSAATRGSSAWPGRGRGTASTSEPYRMLRSGPGSRRISATAIKHKRAKRASQGPRGAGAPLRPPCGQPAVRSARRALSWPGWRPG